MHSDNIMHDIMVHMVLCTCCMAGGWGVCIVRRIVGACDMIAAILVCIATMHI